MRGVRVRVPALLLPQLGVAGQHLPLPPLLLRRCVQLSSLLMCKLNFVPSDSAGVLPGRADPADFVLEEKLQYRDYVRAPNF